MNQQNLTHLIKFLAEGLEIERIPKTKKEFFELKCSQINSADRQLLIALQILLMLYDMRDHTRKI